MINMKHISPKISKFTLFVLVLLLLFTTSSYAFKVTIVTDKDEVIYPQDRFTNMTVTFEKNIIDNIEDIEYELTISGAASFANHNKLITGKIDKLENTVTFSEPVYFTDTSSSGKETIVLNLSGEYVTNAIIGGGKKDLNTIHKIFIISTEKGAVELEKQQVENELSDFKALYKTCLNDTRDLKVQLEKLAPSSDGTCTIPTTADESNPLSKTLLITLIVSILFNIILIFTLIIILKKR